MDRVTKDIHVTSFAMSARPLRFAAEPVCILSLLLILLIINLSALSEEMPSCGDDSCRMAQFFSAIDIFHVYQISAKRPLS